MNQETTRRWPIKTRGASEKLMLLILLLKVSQLNMIIFWTWKHNENTHIVYSFLNADFRQDIRLIGMNRPQLPRYKQIVILLWIYVSEYITYISILYKRASTSLFYVFFVSSFFLKHLLPRRRSHGELCGMLRLWPCGSWGGGGTWALWNQSLKPIKNLTFRCFFHQ